VNHVQVSCSQHSGSAQEEDLRKLHYYLTIRRLICLRIALSMFGRDLTEQVLADAQGGDRQVPIIVEKCIDAVEALGEGQIQKWTADADFCSSTRIRGNLSQKRRIWPVKSDNTAV
jgi:hypothetical protein